MGGRITIKDLGGEIISTRLFRTEGRKTEIVSYWKKIYGKGWKNVIQEIVYDKPNKPDKSTFLKGDVVKKYKYRYGHGGKPNMDRDGRF